MAELQDRRYAIGEVSEMLELPHHVLRQWEQRFPQLKPDRSPTGRRYYSTGDIEIIRRIKYFLRHERMTVAGARLRLSQELHGRKRPENTREIRELVRRIEEEVRGMLDLLDEEV